MWSRTPSDLLGGRLHTTYGWELRNMESGGGRRDVFYQGYWEKAWELRAHLLGKDLVANNLPDEGGETKSHGNWTPLW